MSSSFLEIIELADGGFALRSIEEGSEPLVEIHFSPKVTEFLKGNKAMVVRAMIGAGVQAAGALSQALMEKEPQQEAKHTLH